MPSPDHMAAVENIVGKFLASFSKDVADEQAKQELFSVLDPSVTWTDHGFLARRVGREAIFGLYKSFTHCNQPFEAKLKALHHTSTGAVVEQVWIGNCRNNIVRPDGQVVVKAHGKDFVCHVCMVMEIDPETGIKKIDEYYNKIWEDGIPEEKYLAITGPSMKSE